MGQLKGILAFTIMLVTAMPVAGQSERKDIPFELHDGYLIVVNGSIGRLKNLSFVVDTGSYRSVLDERIARKLHLKSAGSVEELAFNHSVQMDSVVMPELTWGNVTTTSFSALVFDLSPISRFTGIHEDLVLGLDMLRQTNFQVDFRSRRIHFGRNQEPEISIPFVPNVPYVVVEGSIDGHSEKLLLDTGADSLAVFADRLPNDGQSLRTAGIGRDVSGSVPFTRLTGKQLLLGNRVVCGAPVFSISAMADPRYDGSLAPRVLGASKIYFDFELRRFCWDTLKGQIDHCAPARMSAESVSVGP
jgi:predicted aspartyl protease